MNIFIGTVALLALSALLAYCTHDLLRWVREMGYREGYLQGRADESAVWMKHGQQVEEAKRAMWREEAS